MNHIDVMKLGLDAMIYHTEQTRPINRTDAAIAAFRKAIEEAEKNQFNPDWNAVQLLSEENLALHKRIAELEAEKVEPVGQLQEDLYGRGSVFWFNKPKNQSLLYTAPPQREWVGLSAHEMSEIYQYNKLPYEILKATEAKLKEKNHIANAGKKVDFQKLVNDLKRELASVHADDFSKRADIFLKNIADL